MRTVCSLHLLSALQFVIVNRVSYFIDLTLNVFLVFFLACFLWSFLSFCMLAFVGFLSLSRDVIFMLSVFFQATRDSHGTLHSSLGLVCMHSAATFKCTEMKFSYSSFGVPTIHTKSKNRYNLAIVKNILTDLVYLSKTMGYLMHINPLWVI